MPDMDAGRVKESWLAKNNMKNHRRKQLGWATRSNVRYVVVVRARWHSYPIALWATGHEDDSQLGIVFIKATMAFSITDINHACVFLHLTGPMASKI